MQAGVDHMTFRYRGAFFQIPMIFLWGIRGFWFTDQAASATLPFLIKGIGFVLMGVALMRLYPLKRKSEGSAALITTDMFAVTRHPMYHAMYLIDMILFFSPANWANPWFWVTWLVFTFLIFTAGWFQEKETLARWGSEAEAYYSKTPRFVFGWFFR